MRWGKGGGKERDGLGSTRRRAGREVARGGFYPRALGLWSGSLSPSGDQYSLLGEWLLGTGPLVPFHISVLPPVVHPFLSPF